MKKYQLIFQKEGFKQFITAAEYSALNMWDKTIYRLMTHDERDKLINIIDTTGEPNIIEEICDKKEEDR